MTKTCLITGINGMDGANLSRLLLSKRYIVHGVIRRSSYPNTGRIDEIFNPEDRTYIHYGDLQEGLSKLIYEIKPDYIFNTGAMSHVRISFDIPIYTAEVVGVGVIRLLEDIKNGIKWGILKKDTKILQCSSSEMYGTTPAPQNENSIFNPVSPYGISKLMAYHAVRAYRTGYNIFASNSICFNHEGKYRGVNFVTRKITRAAARIALGLQDKIELGNLEALRDWGNSIDYVKAMLMILEHNIPDDFVIATGEYHTVREFAEKVFAYFNLNFYDYLVSNDILRRPVEVPALLGDSTKIRETLGWKPEQDFNGLIKEMCDYDYEQEKRNLK